MKNDNELSELMSKLKEKTYQYAMEMGVSTDGKGFISCLFPDHADTDPSMNWWEEAGVFGCFGCGRMADIFTLAHIFENKPVSGPNFIEENVFYLAQKFGEPYEHLKRDITPEELVRQQYFRTMQLFSDYVTLHPNEEYLSSRNINRDTASKLSIGSVPSYNECVRHLLESGCEKEIIKNIGIDSYKVNQDKLIMIIKDEYGRPCSFTARDMKWSKDSGRPKYINGDTTDIFHKSKIFYLWSDVKKEYMNLVSLVIVEGYLDAVSAYQRGMRNVISIGSASFTDEHIKIIERDRKINSVAIALDQDATGKKRMESIMQRLKNIETTKEYKFAVYKEEGKDIDEILNTNPEYKRTSDIFELRTLFEYEVEILKGSFGEELDDSALFDKFVAIICKTKNAKDREEQARVLGKYLRNYTFQTILDSVREELDGKTRLYFEDVKKKAKLAYDEIIKNPIYIDNIVEELKDDIEHLNEKHERKKINYTELAMQNFRKFEQQKTEANLFEVKFGIPWLDDLETMVLGNSVIISSTANTGKSTFYQTVAKLVPYMNDNAIVFYCSTDDPAEKIYANLMASISGLNRAYCANPYYHKRWGIVNNKTEKTMAMFEKYEKAVTYIEKLIESKKLVIFDVKDGVDTWRGLENKVKEIAADPSNENKFKILVVDSVNKVQVDGYTDENASVGYLSANIKKLSEKHKFLSFLNFELNKAKSNKKLSQYNLSGSKRMFYDCDVLGFVYNPIRNLQNSVEETRMYWERKDEGGFVSREPIIVTIQEKTKAGNNERNNFPYFYRLDTVNNRMFPMEIGSKEDKYYREIWDYEWNTLYTAND